jgi:hypothetical protein
VCYRLPYMIPGVGTSAFCCRLAHTYVSCQEAIVSFPCSDVVNDVINNKLPEGDGWGLVTSGPQEPDGPWISPTIYYAHVSNTVNIDFYMVCAHAAKKRKLHLHADIPASQLSQKMCTSFTAMQSMSMSSLHTHHVCHCTCRGQKVEAS